MAQLSSDRWVRFPRLGRRLDHVFCVAVFIAGCMPAIVVMLILAFPLLPLFGVWVSLLAAAEGLTKVPPRAEWTSKEAEHKHEPDEHTTATPHYA